MGVNDDQLQFIGLFRENHKFLYMCAVRYVNDHDIAKDIVQDFFINYWEKRQNSLTGNFEGYAARSIKNRCISYIRSQQTADKRINQFGNETYCDVTDEDEEAIDKETLKLIIFKAIEQLPPERKKIILLSAKEGLSNKLIAEQLGISIHTVKSQLVKAYAFIRKETQEIGGGPAGKVNKNYDAILSVLILSCLCSVDYGIS